MTEFWSLPEWLNLFSQAVVIFILSQLSLALLWLSSKTLIGKFHFAWQSTLLWLMVTLPWLVSIGGLFLSGQYDFFHWHHSFIFSWKSWHGISLVISLLLSLYLFGKAIYALVHYNQQDHKRRSLALFTCNAEGYFKHAQPLAFTSGLLQPRVYISTGLAEKLTANELTMVIVHEQAHADRYDPLQKWLFLLLASFYPRVIAHPLIQTMDLSMEVAADQKIIKQFNVLDVAEALLKIARMMNSTSSQVQHRLHYLLATEALRRKVLTLMTPVIILALQLALPFLTVVFAMDFIHHFFDQWLWHFS